MRGHWRTALIWTAVALALAAVFALYAAPELARELADQVWACF
ncbi:hypothetical protein [Caldimonas tepidiphila]|nr:hypothetical protein [Caldimonas tepidiphila]